MTNPLFPISHLRSVVLNGTVEDKPFRTETTLLPDTRIIEWSPGQCVRILVGDVATLEWVRDRIVRDRDSVVATRIDADLAELRSAAADDDLESATETATGLREVLAESG